MGDGVSGPSTAEIGLTKKDLGIKSTKSLVPKVVTPITEVASESQPRVLSYEESLNLAKRDFGQPKTNDVSQQINTESYISEHVKVVRYQGIDITIIGQEWSDESRYLDQRSDTPRIHPVIKAYINSARTRGCVVEYFDPEILNNALNTPLVGETMVGMMNREPYDKSDRIEFARQIAEVVKDAGKPIFVADIGNKPAYAFLKVLTKALAIPSLAVGFFGESVGLPSQISSALLALGVYEAAGAYQENMGVGMFDKKKIHEFERLLPDVEDARRVFVAEGLRKIIPEYKTSPTGNEALSQLVVVYPPAHANRIVDFLSNPSLLAQRSQDVKKVLYKVFPGLDFSARTWEWKDTLAKLSGNNTGHWVKTSDQPL